MIDCEVYGCDTVILERIRSLGRFPVVYWSLRSRICFQAFCASYFTWRTTRGVLDA